MSNRAAILVVDDNPPTRYSTTRVLKSAGFEVVEAATGQDALDLCQTHLDLVVLDVHLPDIDGFEVCRRLRRQTATARLPVIHLSATFVNDDHKVQGLDAGADGYLTHPVEPPVLVATVKAFLRARYAEEAMRASEAKFTAVFERAVNGIAFFNSDLIFVDVNPALSATFGRDRDQIIGKHLSAFDVVSRQNLVEDIRARLDGGGTWSGLLPVLNASGQHVQLEWNISLHSLPGLRLAITTDVTGRALAEAERERLLASERNARADAERANQMKDDFLAALSHELRTPLNAIAGWSGIVKQRVVDGDPLVVKGIDAIERNARVQAQLMSDLLDVSRATSGKLQLDREWFDPATAIEDAVASMRTTASLRNIEIVLQFAEEPAEVFWDPTRFQQVVWNLVENAVKFSPEGAVVRVVLKQTGSSTEIEVRDQGCGISSDFLPLVFDRFRQEQSGTRRRHGGLGLGLTIVKHIVDAHAGFLKVESPGEHQGSTFTVTIPGVARQPGQAAARDSNVLPLSLEGVLVLVVDDDADARGLIRRILEEADAAVTEAANVEDALRQLKEKPPDILISDIGMPGLDGYDLIRLVRTDGYDARTLPAIALTAFAREPDRTRAFEAGYQFHLTKPASTMQLLGAISSLVIRTRAGRRNDTEEPR